MVVTRRLTALALVILLSLGVLSMAGCNEDDKAGKTDQKSQTPTTTAKASEKDRAEEVNANWTISVNDKTSVDVQGLPIDYTLSFTASKAGGTDPTGTYKGTAHLTMKSDVSKFKGLPQSVVKTMGSIDGEADAKDLTFKVITFADARKGKRTSASDDSDFTLATLVPPGTKTTGTLPEPTEEDKAVSNPDFFSSGYMEMAGMGKIDIQAKGIGGERAQYSDQKSASDKISFSMNIVGATVYIDIPNAGRFKGTVTGDPID